ncbi:MAG TPA: hypothetical protein VD789_11005, partial [Thermomicrobiales bacterium]|nr:hypothetical protein [Thermomicrobiales bacterium]
MTDLDRHGRAERPYVAGEPETLLGFLNYRRVTPAWKSRGRDAVVLRATVGAPTIPLGGQLKQVSFAEDFWL